MNTIKDKPIFSEKLQAKIDKLKARREKVQLGNISFDSPLLLAPMSAITNFPFRVLMEELGAGGTVSELISCHGINYGNERTREMLRIHPREKNVGLQLFGEDEDAMAKAAIVANEYNPKFIDINMGCPVKKVVSKGGGSALLKDTAKLGTFFNKMKSSISVPLTIKIRTGWDEETINAPEVIRIAKEEGVEFVAIHGRTRTQQYKGYANWELLESIKAQSPLPIIGNGDLHTPELTRKRMAQTSCDALMLGRGPLRNPFIFLESYLQEGEESEFTPADYVEVMHRLMHLIGEYTDKERTHLVQLRKHVVWFAAGFGNAANFRNVIFNTQTLEDSLKISEDYFLGLGDTKKKVNPEETFMAGGHG